MIICPNCGKENTGGDKCVYCKYPFIKKEHPFDQEQYQYLKEEYIKEKNKAAAIKSGMKRFGISMQEAKKIVDFIGDELYDEQHVRSKELVDGLLKDEKIGSKENCYTFSFMAYFVHVLVFQIIDELVLAGAIQLCAQMGVTRKYPVIIVLWLILEFVLAVRILAGYGKNSTIRFQADPGNYVYRHRITAVGGKRRVINFVTYRISCISKVEEHWNNFVIYGKITKGVDEYGRKKKTVNVKSVKIPKNFRRNKELLEKLNQSLARQKALGQ